MKMLARVAMLCPALLLGACLHHPGVSACTPAPGESECWASQQTNTRGALAHEVTERVTPVEGGCDIVELEHTYFDADGVLDRRVSEVRRCGLVQQRVEERFDLEAGRIHREYAVDLDRDDNFDTVERRDLALSPADRQMALAGITR